MINLLYNDEVTLVFDANDWFKLRIEHRIIGELIGTNNITRALPLALSPEETILLVKNGIGQLLQWNKQNTPPTKEHKEKYELEITKLHEDEKVILKNERKLQIESVIKKIVDGKKKKGFVNDNTNEIMQNELNKLPEVKRENIITQICTKHPEFLRDEPTTIPLENVYKYTNELKIAVFEDLWNKGYYITTGRKFGCDFLVYLGDPIKFHAMFLIKCVEDPNKKSSSAEIIAFGRLGNSVKKKSVLASLAADNTLQYITVNWMDS